MEAQITKTEGPGTLVSWVDSALHSIVNSKLPTAYTGSAELILYDEHLAVEVGKHQHRLKPERGARHLPMSSQVRGSRVLSESEPMHWVQEAGVRVSRRVRLLQSDRSRVDISMRFMAEVEGGANDRRTLMWSLTLPGCKPFVPDTSGQGLKECPQGDLSTNLRRQGLLMFSLNSQRLDSPENRILIIQFGVVEPYKINLTVTADGKQVVSAFFNVERLAEAQAVVDLSYVVLVRQDVGKTVFLVARTDDGRGSWQAAIAASMSWIDRLETCRETEMSGPGFRRFAPFLWFDAEKPLPDPVMRFLHSMSGLQRIIVFGEVLPHDLENLLSALLDKGSDETACLQIFTTDEYYRDRVNVLRGNIQARMIITDESSERVRNLEEIVTAEVVPSADLLPLALRRFMEAVSRRDLLALPVRDTTVFLLRADARQARFLAAACVPMARYLAAPILIWHRDTEHETILHLKAQAKEHGLKRVFLVGGFSPAEEEAIRSALGEQALDVSAVPAAASNRETVSVSPGTAPGSLLVTRLPYEDPVRVAVVMAGLLKSQVLLDWLVRMLRIERESLVPPDRKVITEAVTSFVEAIRDRPWADRLVCALDSLLEHGGSIGVDVYQDMFVGRDEFISSFNAHLIRAAEMDQESLNVLSPVWNDLVVLSDFNREDHANLNVFPAACFAAFHEAPLLLYPAIAAEEEEFLNTQVRQLEMELHGLTRAAAAVESIPATARKPDLLRMILPADVRAAIQLISPLNIALYTTDTKVPYEVISDREGPVGLKYVIGRLGGADAYDTSLVTAAGMMYSHELQRTTQLSTLLCLANVPGLAPLQMERERKVVVARLFKGQRLGKAGSADRAEDDQVQVSNDGGQRFAITYLEKPDEIRKERVLEHLARPIHLFHYSGHGYEDSAEPQRSGFVLARDDHNQHSPHRFSPLTALEIKFRAKLGSHPIVFLNSCFMSSNSRIRYDIRAPGDETREREEIEERFRDAEAVKKTVTGLSVEQTMGVSTSLIHIGAAAVMAPLWMILDDTSIIYADFWYEYMVQGCSIGEAALLAKIDSIAEMKRQLDAGNSGLGRVDHTVLSYAIYGDPTIRLYPLSYMIREHPDTARRLVQLGNNIRA